MAYYDEVTADDIEMFEELYSHYGTAPIFAFVGQKLSDGEAELKECVTKHNARSTFFFFGEEKSS